MKKTLLTLALVATTVAAFAQGRVTFVNDSSHLFVLGNTLGADAAIGGGGASGTNGAIAGVLPSGVTLIAGLYAGTSSTSMTLQSSTTLLTGAGLLEQGRMSSKVTAMATVPGGVPQWFQIAIWDSAVPSWNLSQTYYGLSPLFQATPSTSAISAPSIMPGSPANSTLAAQLNIVVNAVPEPSSFALAGMGLASLLIFRRRK